MKEQWNGIDPAEKKSDTTRVRSRQGGRWFWCERRLYAENPALGYEERAILLCLAAILGPAGKGEQAGITRLTTLHSLLRLGKERCREALRVLEWDGWLRFGGAAPGMDDRFAYQLLGAADPGIEKPREKVKTEFFWVNRSILNLGRDLHATGLAVYGCLCDRADGNQVALAGNEKLESRLGVGDAPHVLRKLEKLKVIEVLPPETYRTGEKTLNWSNAYRLLALEDPGDKAGQGSAG